MASTSIRSNFAEFQRSRRDADIYPLNLLRTESWKHTLDRYLQALNECKSSQDDSNTGLLLFDEGYESIFALDYSKTTNYFHLSQELTDVDQLQQLMVDTAEDLPYRYIFIHADSSRSPLACSKKQLMLILTHYQTMAPFLDHVFTFCEREDPHMQASFRSEDYLSLEDQASALTELGRSGLQVQHCFNLIGVEHDESNQMPYLYRQAAAYYSFDPIGAQSVWVVLKANEVLRDSIQQSSNDSVHQRTLCDLATPETSFEVGLRTHLLIYDWCLENWTPYIDFLEAKIKESAGFVKHTPIAGLTKDQNIELGFSKRSTMQSGGHSRQNSGFQRRFSHTRSASWKKVVEAGRKLRNTGGHTKLIVAAPLPLQPAKAKMDELDLDEIFTFDQLQSLHLLASDLDRAKLVLSQNKKVLEEMLERFHDLAKSREFCRYIKVDQVHFEMFFRRTRRSLRELENQETRIHNIQAGLDKDVSLFNGILQYKSMRTGEYFSRHAKVSTDKMEQLTVRTKQDTVSIHVITILTLVFLPGTFVAVRYGMPYLYDFAFWALTECQTFFSSGILDFEESVSMLNLGDWTTRWGALKLFGLICGPLMGLVLTAWALAYRLARQHQNVQSASVTKDIEKGK